MKPLSILKYYMNNKKRFFSVFTAVLLSVYLICFVQMLIDSSFSINYRTFVEPQKYFSSIAAKSRVLDRELIRKVSSIEGAEKILPWVFHYTNFNSSIGGNIGTKVLTVKSGDMRPLMAAMHLTLREGELPGPGTDGIALHYLVAANKHLKVGDKIGSSQDRNEALQGERVVTGLLDGESIVSFESLEYWMKQNNVTKDDYSLGMILLPGKGGFDSMNKALESLDSTGLDVRTYRLVLLQNKGETESVYLLLTLINIMVIAIVAICTGFISYIYFLQRRSEFGILSAIGYSGRHIAGRAFGEIASINCSAWAGGTLLSIIVGELLNLCVFLPKGQPLELWNPDYLLKTACVPLFAAIFSIIPVWRMLREFDPLGIIEGVEQ